MRGRGSKGPKSLHLGPPLASLLFVQNALSPARPLPPRPTHPHHHTRPAALFWPLQVQIDPDMSLPLQKMQTVEPWASSGVAVATDAASVSHLLARWASVDGEETLLEMLHDSVLERGMAEGDAVEVEGRVNASTRIAMWIKGAIVDVGLDAASVDVLCMVLDLD